MGSCVNTTCGVVVGNASMRRRDSRERASGSVETGY